jgi:hypothetical protein
MVVLVSWPEIEPCLENQAFGFATQIFHSKSGLVRFLEGHCIECDYLNTHVINTLILKQLQPPINKKVQYISKDNGPMWSVVGILMILHPRKKSTWAWGLSLVDYGFLRVYI